MLKSLLVVVMLVIGFKTFLIPNEHNFNYGSCAILHFFPNITFHGLHKTYIAVGCVATSCVNPTLCSYFAEIEKKMGFWGYKINAFNVEIVDFQRFQHSMSQDFSLNIMTSADV